MRGNIFYSRLLRLSTFKKFSLPARTYYACFQLPSARLLGPVRRSCPASDPGMHARDGGYKWKKLSVALFIEEACVYVSK
ncbi:hypothetical protein PGT21_017685 [Puccinia graminis f. sp. tritici]|uniref:Uncharacterized protein n=1 Tax=Puccinia graminis f. sp. tritici TaxID=56615 RepID=A0A5B0N4B0_PUCGR|nr:hypothetical protein PGT21_017685 [Puccinia graminis f. sp. tritici]KAA1093342.1 hypothetical protein PGTUg99_023373 [Puccinia graminis f. sp. tritici]